MKKLLIIVIACIAAFSTFAQLPKTILNCTLGESTPINVKNIFTKKGFEPSSNKDGSIFVSFLNRNHPTIDDTTPKFLNTWWSSALLKFDNGVLSGILFQNSYKNLDFAKIYYNIVKDYLDQNYPQDYWTTITPENKPNYKELEGVIYNSGKIYYKLFILEYYGDQVLTPVLTLQVYYK